MKFPHIFENIAALALLVLSLLATPAATAQTVLSNETLVSTTLVVNTQSATARCGKAGCLRKDSHVRHHPGHLPGTHRADMHFPYFARCKGFPEQRMGDFLSVLGRWCRTNDRTHRPLRCLPVSSRMSSESRACPSAKAIPLLW